jgi:cobalt/nickel transport system permease protein
VSGGHDHVPGPTGRTASPVHRLDPRAKIIGLVTVTAVSVSTPLPAWPVWILCAAVLITIAAVARIHVREIWRRSRVVLPLVLFVAAFIPFARSGTPLWSFGPLTVSDSGVALLAEVSMKATIGTLCAVLLAATTSVSELLHGLETLRVPRLLTLIGSFMYRYLFVIRDEFRRMRTGLAARGYRPRNLVAVAPLGRLLTAMFLRSYGRGERVYLAMASRGYRGTMPRLVALRVGPADMVFVGAIAALLVPPRVLL